MDKEKRENPLEPILCQRCAVTTAGIMVLGTCEECGRPTSSGAYRYCAKCATKHGICCQCGDPLDAQHDG